MSTISILESIKTFLLEKVSPEIKLQQANDKNIQDYELVNPHVFVGWIPPNGYLPEGMETAIPCLIVGLDEAEDNSDEEEYKIRISAVVFSPGYHEPTGAGIKYTPDFQGYHDLLNLIDRTTAELRKNRIISGKASMKDPIKWGMYQEQPYPYWYGWITFTAGYQSYPASELAKNYL